MVNLPLALIGLVAAGLGVTIYPESLIGFLGRTVEAAAGVVLLVDVGCVLDPHPLDEVTLDVHAEDVAGVLAHLGLGPAHGVGTDKDRGHEDRSRHHTGLLKVSGGTALLDGRPITGMRPEKARAAAIASCSGVPSGDSVPPLMC